MNVYSARVPPPGISKTLNLMSGNASDRESPYQIWEICLNRGYLGDYRLIVFHPDVTKTIVKQLLQPSVLATKLRRDRRVTREIFIKLCVILYLFSSDRY